jgi:hypothetical protein
MQLVLIHQGDPDAELPADYYHHHYRTEEGKTGGGEGAGEGDEAGEGVVGGGGDAVVVGRILRTELGPHDDATFAAADIIVLSPGVPLTQPQVAAALLRSSVQNENNGGGGGGGGGSGGGSGGVVVTSELAFASQCLPPALPVAAVTGTNGKSTVCTFVGQLLESCGAQVFVGGNLGTPVGLHSLPGVRLVTGTLLAVIN